MDTINGVAVHAGADQTPTNTHCSDGIRKRRPCITVIQFSPPICVTARAEDFRSVVQQLTGRKRAIDSVDGAVDKSYSRFSQRGKFRRDSESTGESPSSFAEKQNSCHSSIAGAPELNQPTIRSAQIEKAVDLGVSEQLIGESYWNISTLPTLCDILDERMLLAAPTFAQKWVMEPSLQKHGL